MQNIRINMQTLCGNRWKDEWWLKENWRRDAARFSILPPPESWLKASRGSTSLCTQAAVWRTDCDIRRWVRPDAALALPPRPGELAPPRGLWAASAGNHFCHVDQRGIDHHTRKESTCCVWMCSQEYMRRIQRNFREDKVKVVPCWSVVLVITAAI